MSVIFIDSAFMLMWVVPNILSWLDAKQHLLHSVSKLLSNSFLLVFILNTVLIAVGTGNRKVPIIINSIAALFIGICLLAVTLFECKEKVGSPSKQELKILAQAVSELQTVLAVASGEQNTRLSETICEMMQIQSGKYCFLHGIERNILETSSSIKMSFLSKDSDGIERNIAMLDALLKMAVPKEQC